MTVNTTPILSDVLTDVVAVINSIVPPKVSVMRGIANRVAAPNPIPGFVVVTPLYQGRLAWNVNQTPAGPLPSTETVRQSTRADLQIDFYGTYSGVWAAQFVTLWRDEYACALMQNSQPLYADEARMIPLVDSEQQYEERWMVEAAAQYNPVTTVSQGYADALDVTLIDVEQRYPT
jgi:hypothetical protein